LYVYTYGFAGENIHILNNTFSGGYYCAYVYGYDGSGPGLNGYRFEGNNLSNAYYYGAYMYYFKNATIIGNTIDQVGGSSYVNSYGLMLYGYGSGYEIRDNRVHAGYYGMYVYSMSGTNAKKGIFANNIVMIGDTALNITSGYYALYFYNCGFFTVAHNTIISQTTNGYTAYIYGGLNEVHNNIFARVNSGTCMYINGAFSVTEMDNNAYMLTNGASSGLSYTQGLGFDDNGVEVGPLYATLDVMSMETCNDTLVGAGTPIADVPMDIQGSGRSTSAPTIGPFEYISPGGFSLGDDLKICAGDTILLGSQIVGAKYTWTTGDTTGTIMITSPGTYGVQVVTACGTGNDAVDVTDASSIPGFSPDSSWMTVSFTNTSVNGVTYLWDFGDGKTSTDKDPVHLYSTPGWYNVCLTAYGECDDNTTCMDVRAWDGTGIDEHGAHNVIEVYPNPASEVLTVEAAGVEGNVLSIEISNIAGQVVLNSQLNDFNGYAKEQLDISSLMKGVYFVKIFTSEVTTTKRLVVQK
jgi:hypothetical protein